MPRITLDDIIRRGHLMADVPEPSTSRTDAFATQSEIIDVANAGLGELHDLLAEVYEDWLTITVDINMAAATQTTLLPADFLKLRHIFQLDSGQRIRMEEFHLDDMTGSTRTETTDRPLYRIMGSRIYWHELPGQAYTVELWYVRQFSVLTNRDDEISPELPVGWEDYPIGHVAKYLADKKELSSTAGTEAKDRARGRIIQVATNRNASKPGSVRDVSGRFDHRRTRHYPYPRKP